MDEITPQSIDKSILLRFEGNNGQMVEVKRFPEGYMGDPRIKALKERIRKGGVEPLFPLPVRKGCL